MRAFQTRWEDLAHFQKTYTFFVLFAGLFSWHFRTYNFFKTFWCPNFTCERTTGDSDGDEAFGNVIIIFLHVRGLGLGTDNQSDVTVSPVNASDLLDFSDPASLTDYQRMMKLFCQLDWRYQARS